MSPLRFLCTQTCRVSRCSKGAAIIELAIVLTTLGVFVAGLISAGLAFQNAAIASDVTRHAGRAGAANSYNFTGSCTPSFSSPCATLTDAGATLNQATAFLACQYLNSSGIVADDWAITVNIDGPLIEDSLARYVLRVGATKTAAADPVCRFCWSSVLDSIAFQGSSSSFALESDCV